MDASRKRTLGLAAVGTLALVAGGTAFAAGKLGHGQTTAGTGSGLGDLVAASGSGGGSGSGYGYGRGFGFGGMRGMHMGGGGAFHRGEDLSAAADYLGTTASDLQTQLASGKTLAQIANATSGKSASGLIDALVASEQTELQQAVTGGRLTQAQADQIQTNLRDRITAMVNGERPARPDGAGPPPWAGPGSTPGSTITPSGTHI